MAVAVVAALALLAGLLPAVAGAAQIEVTTSSDTTADDGLCTLREAIVAANGDTASGATAGECVAGDAAPALDTISITTGAIITPAAPFPLISSPTIIDGTAAPNAAELNGPFNAAGTPFLNFLSAGSGVRSLHIYNVAGDIFSPAVQVQGANSIVDDVTIGFAESGIESSNAGNGVEVNGLAHGTSITDSVISSNTFAAVQIEGADNVSVSGNLIGTDQTGNTAASAEPGGDGNGTQGIRVQQDATGTVIGGPDPADGNVIAASDFNGIEINWTPGLGPISGTVIENNKIGIGADGSTPLGNGSRGIYGSGDVQATEIRDNVIADSDQEGVYATQNGTQDVGDDGPSGWVLTGNRIGTSADGATLLENGVSDAAVEFRGSPDHPVGSNVIGGSTGLTPGGACTGDCNVIAGSDGLVIDGGGTGGADSNQVLGNHLGTDAAGTGAGFGGGVVSPGVYLDDNTNATIGSSAAPNVISGNGNHGLSIVGGGDNVASANLIGVASDGAGALGNGLDGILVSDSDGNLIGGTAAGAGNEIANNGDDGVRVIGTADGNSIIGNSIHDNDEEPIDLNDDGVTANDGLGDPDAGPNGLQNFPELLAAVLDPGAGTVVPGRLQTAASTDYLIELFENDAGDDEAETPIGSIEVTTDGSGLTRFVAELGTEVAGGAAITATATELDGTGGPLSTSEVSAVRLEGTGCDAVATGGADLLCGTAGSDQIDGLGGGDLILGLGGGDTLIGGAGTDTLVGSGGNDALRGDGGNDILDGGEGTDEAGYLLAPGAVDVDLGAGGAADDGTGAVDALVDVEDVTGSAFADSIAGDGGANAIAGGGGGDVIDGLGAADDLRGDGGADTIDGGFGGDTIDGGAEGDTLNGEGGADTIDGGDGGDTIDGGTEADTISGDAGVDTIDGGDGGDQVDGGTEGDTLNGDAGADTIDGGDGGDTIDGGTEADTLNGDDGGDTIDGGSGGDDIDGGQGGDDIDGGADADTIEGGTEGDSLDGGGGDDDLSGSAGADTLSGADGDDTVAGGAEADSLDGGSGIDELDGGEGDDEIAGGDGDDELDGGAGKDEIDGDDGADTLDGRDGADTLTGGNGDDTLRGGDEGDTLKGKKGDDTAKGQNGKDTIKTGGGDDTLVGGDKDDTLSASSGKDTLKGQDGDDTLKGGGDKDKLRGGKGDDTLRGKGGKKDDLKGEGGKDSLDGGAGGKDVCDGGPGKDDKKTPGCETVRKIP